MSLPSSSRRRALAPLTALAAVLVSVPAAAQVAPGINANRFDPAEKGSDWFENESLDFRGGPFRPALGIVADYAKDPIALQQSDQSTGASLVQDQFFVHLGIGATFFERFRLGIELPIALAQDGNQTLESGTPFSTYNGPGKAAFGDLRLDGTLLLYGKYRSPFSIAAGVQGWLPTGSEDQYTSDGKPRIMPRLMIAGDIDIVAYSLRAGYSFNGAQYEFYQSGNAPPQMAQNELSLGGALGLRLVDKKLLVGPEISMYSGEQNLFHTSTTPTEILFGAHYRFDDWQVGAGVGTALAQGDAVGSPSLRLLLGVEWQPHVKEAPPPPDRDADGIPDQFDACPDQPGPFSEQASVNGCPLPPPDRDKDGIPDDVDACPDTPGVKTNDPKTNGCPSDRDHDGIIDAEDACPDTPGVKTSDPKTNGCPPPPPPDPDRDKDGIPNDVDACPDEAGPKNDDPKKNGCPLAFVKNGEIKITEQVKFATASARILPESDKVLGAVLAIINAHPEIEKIKVEGYTDNKGSAAYNKTLSAQRAASVQAWLVLHKVDKKKLDSAGFGQDRPIDTNDTDAGRANNRRVEFHIVNAPGTGDATKPAAPPAKP